MMQEMLAVRKSGTAAVSWVAEAQDEVLQIEGKHLLHTLFSTLLSSSLPH